MNKLSRKLFMLTPFTVICGLVIAFVYTWINPRIAEQQEKTRENIYLEALQLQPSPDIKLDSTTIAGDTTLLDLRNRGRIYLARQDNRIIGIVLPVTAREGYAGDIDLLVGLNTDGNIIAIRVVSHNETRNIGDKVLRDRWFDQFKRMHWSEAQKDQWRLRSDGGKLDGITGATVTSRAVVKAIRQSLEYFEAHRTELLSTGNVSIEHDEN